MRGTECRICDALAFISRGVSNIISKGHVFMYRHAPWVFRSCYSYSEDHEELFSPGSPVYRLMGFGVEALHSYIVKNGFDTVICPHIFGAIMVTQMLYKYPGLVKSAFIGTDYTCSPGTQESALDFYFMPAREDNMPLDKNKVCICGIPVRRDFYKITDKNEAKRKLGIPQNKKHLLVMCGSMGCGHMKTLTSHLVKEIGDDAFISIICGTNKKLRLQLLLRYSGRPNMKIMGYAKNMPLIMDSADLYLTKPGGISTSEAIVKALPMVLIDAVAGCEKYNREYMLATGIADTADSHEKLAVLCAELLKDEKKLDEMHRCALNLPRENAAEFIYEKLANYEKKVI